MDSRRARGSASSNANQPVDSCAVFVNALLDPAAVSDAGGVFLAANQALRNLLGYTEAEYPALVMPVPTHRRGEPEHHLRACLQGEQVIAVPTELRHRDHHTLPVLLTLSALQGATAAEPLVLWTYRPSAAAGNSLPHPNRMLEDEARSRERALDQTVHALEAEVQERREIEEQLRLSQGRLRQLSRKTLDLLERDRQAIAKELHDSIGASLAAIKFSLEGWVDAYGHRFPSSEIPFDSIIDHILETIKETKRISADLRPTTLDDLGLLATARWFCRNLARRHGGLRITMHLDVSEDDIPEALKIVLYRVLQEALINAVRHSGAEEVRVELGLKSGQVEMTITDEGRGFDAALVDGTGGGPAGLGITSMRERVEICNGTFELRTRIGGGTRIRARLPVAHPAETACNVAAAERAKR